MKNTRHEAILDIIRNNEIETQSDLANALIARGVQVTQATISRDIKELQLMKLSTEGGKYKYAVKEKEDNEISDRLVRIFRESVLRVTVSENLIVLNTISGSANAAGEAIDSMNRPEIIGSICGDNTIFVAIRSADESEKVADVFRGLLRK